VTEEERRVHLHISGRVQGVYYRVTAADEARRLGLSGWVKNLPDGRVEAVAEGRLRQLERFVSWCRQGPPAAEVANVDADWSDAAGDLDSFQVHR
jgi:acylphosphatase